MNAKELVRGEIIKLKGGDKVPADVRVIDDESTDGLVAVESPSFDALADAVALNTAKAGITAAQASAIEANSAKQGVTALLNSLRRCDFDPNFKRGVPVVCTT